ncbi:MAG: hypothetical protein H0S79_09715 [Anaerolineaceae bacterium]|nr:hypothetical protein [Anaerolineaceae bacterium]
MEKSKTLRRRLLLIVPIMVLLLAAAGVSMTDASTEPPEGVRASWLSPTVADMDTYRVTLTINNLMGTTPPSAKWYDPDGVQISVGGSPVREYTYLYGSLFEINDYFYIRGRDLEPGRYSVVVTGYFNGTFRIESPEFLNYLPLILE